MAIQRGTNGSGSREPGSNSSDRLLGGGDKRTRNPQSQSAARREFQQTRPNDDESRGRQASKPSDIPARGWKDILWRVYENINDHRIMAVAAGVTFYVLLALFPGIAALVSLYGLFADPTVIGQHLADLSGVIPEGAKQVIGDQLNNLTSHGSSTLGVTFLLTLAISLWSANSGMKAMFDALNVVYGEREKRSFIKLNALSLAFTLCAIALHVNRARGYGRATGGAELHRFIIDRRLGDKDRPLARTADHCFASHRHSLSLRTQSG